MDQNPFSHWMEILKDVTIVEEIARTLSEGQRTDVIAAILNASTADARRRTVSWINDKYGTAALMRDLLTKLQTPPEGMKKTP